MSEPWAFDYQLELPAVQRLAAENGLRGSVQPLGAGWDYATFLCGELVLRIPKRAHTAALLEDERRLLCALGDTLSLRTPQPGSALIRGTGLPYAAMVYPLLVGEPLGEFSGEPGKRPSHAMAVQIGAQIGAFLTELAARAAAVNAQAGDWSMPAWPDAGLAPSGLDEEWRQRGLLNIEALAPLLSDALRRDLTAELNTPLPAIASRTCLCHDDLNGDHILVDAAGQAIAVIDWGDCAIAPWWLDFVGVWQWGGYPALEAALHTHNAALATDELIHLRRRALLASIGECRYEVQSAPKAWAPEAERYLRTMLE